jgi:lipopolysaccharide assembly protein A
MRAFFFLVLLIVAGVVGVFAFQNQEMVTIQFFDWSVSYPLAIVVGIVYLAGMVSGWTVLGTVRRSFRRVTQNPVR